MIAANSQIENISSENILKMNTGSHTERKAPSAQNGKTKTAKKMTKAISQKKASIGMKTKKDSKGEQLYVKNLSKVRPCRFYAKGRCNNGIECNFIHDPSLKTIKKGDCKHFLRGYCSKGADCLYSHNTNFLICSDFALTSWCNYGEKCVREHVKGNICLFIPLFTLIDN